VDAFAEFARTLVECLATCSGDADNRPLPMQRHRDRAADTAARAGDQRLLSRKVEH
jgi:hypothetical protein